MKFHKATLSLLSSSFFLTSNFFCTSVAASASTALRGVGDVADADVDIVLAEEKRGVFLVAETEYEDGHDSQTFNIMIDDIIYELDDVEEDLDLDLEATTTTKGLKSGQAIIIPPGVALDASSGKAKLNGAKIKPDGDEEQEKGLSLSGRDLSGEQQRDVDQLHRHLNTRTFGDKTVVAVRVKARDRDYQGSEELLRRRVFGLNFDGSPSDELNLSSRYEQCSYGQLKFSPLDTQVGIDNGVVTVSLNMNVVGKKPVDVQKEVTSALKSMLGTSSLSSVADYWMYCLPPDTVGTDAIGGRYWKTISYANSWLSVYNNRYCDNPSAEMHSIGRGLNFPLSKEGEGIDESGMMGRIYLSYEGTPVMCFNAAKSWQSGWYGLNGAHGDKTLTLDSADDCLETSLSGIADYDTTSNPVLIKLQGDFFVAFNAKKGINSGTKEAGNQVTIVQQVGGGPGSAPPSKLLAKLSAGESYTTFNNWTVEVHSITGSDVANVRIYYYSDYTCPSKAPTITNSPTQNPTPSPTYERNGPQSASYDASFGTPKCSFGSSCNSEDLLDGRGNIRGGNEPNQSNTLNNHTCTDGDNGSYHSDESIDKIVVSQAPGILDDMTEGDTVTITATVWCWDIGTGTSDYIDFYYASDASDPVWNQIGERQHCPGGGAQTVTASYTLPGGARTQAVRVNMMYENNTASEESCVTNEFDDTDDLIISVMPKRTNSPSLSPSSSPSDQPTTATPTSLPSFSPTETPSTTSMPSNWPSLQPSPSPSLSPSTKPMKTLVCGSGDVPNRRRSPCFREGGLETTAAVGTEHEVRCCRDCEGIACSEPWQSKCPSYDPNLFALSEYNGFCMKGTFEEAVDFCRSIPGGHNRLCTPDELKNGCAKNTGCSYNNDLIWSCAYDGHVCSTDEECCGTCNASGICEGESTTNIFS